jgi:hypothetical protein
MVNGISEISTLNDLRGFVKQTICDRNQLLLGECRVNEKILVRYGKPCGLYFTVCGPRTVQFSAIWDADRSTILFYGCNGDRFQPTDLTVSARLQEELASLAGTNDKKAA